MSLSSLPIITGVGLVTPLARGAKENFSALLEGKSISGHARISEINSPRAAHLAILAASEAIDQANWNASIRKDDQTAIIVGTSKGPIERWIDEPVSSDIGIGVGGISLEIARSFEFGIGPRMTYSAACASALHALIAGAMMLLGGRASRVLVVGVEASVHPMFISSFDRLGVLAKEGERCRSFDMHRGGFLMSEAAAAICLEMSPAKHLGVAIDRFALGSDAIHITASDPAGRSLQRMIRDVKGDQPVDLVHAHGTGTKTNDPIEVAAIGTILPAQTPIYSHKGALGHSLGASGLVSIVINTLCHQRGIVPGNVHTTEPIESPLRIHGHILEKRIDRSLTLASGFGGSAAAVALVSVR